MADVTFFRRTATQNEFALNDRTAMQRDKRQWALLDSASVQRCTQGFVPPTVLARARERERSLAPNSLRDVTHT